MIVCMKVRIFVCVRTWPKKFMSIIHWIRSHTKKTCIPHSKLLGSSQADRRTLVPADVAAAAAWLVVEVEVAAAVLPCVSCAHMCMI
jgi:hypothetical protein